MISKLVDIEGVKFQDMHRLQYRMSGDTMGRALSIIGDLMKIETKYDVCLKGIEDNIRMDMHLFNTARDVVYSMGLKHFVFNKNALTIEYDIWRDPSEIR